MMQWTPILLLLLATVLAGQTPATRVEEIEAAKETKLKALKPEEVSKAENFLRRFKDDRLLEKFGSGYNGFRPKIGNMVTGGGFAAGLEYMRDDLMNGGLTARASAQVSTRAYQKYQLQGTLPKLAKGKLAVDLIASHRNFGGLNYYGQGPQSRLTGRSNYRLEDTSFDGIAGVSLGKLLKVGSSAGMLLTNVGPGTDQRFISTDRQFGPAVAPGIDQQTNFLRYSVFTQLDYRDNPDGAKSGGNYVFQHSWYKDQELSRFDFRRMDIELEQHIPFLNRTRRLVLRAKGTFTETDNNKPVPFYLQPIVGGSDDLRGYRFFRFTDRNAVVYNAEYRWEVFSGMDGALFFDAGKVMPQRGMLAFSQLETSAGFGLRFNANNATFLRLDVGFSQEGFQVWFKFNDLLNNRKFGTNTLQPAY
jgi:outer membrane protein assembly factor BamA